MLKYGYFVLFFYKLFFCYTAIKLYFSLSNFPLEIYTHAHFHTANHAVFPTKPMR